MTGHNILLRENVIASVLYLKKGCYETVVRKGQCIFKIPFNEQSALPHGNGLLIDYENMKIYHLVYHSGRLIKKIV
jgi:hypothetical protein